MSAPIIYIGFPLAIAFTVWFLRNYRKLCVAIVAISSLLLVLMAFLLPIETLIKIGQWSFELKSELIFFGRKFILNNNDRPFLSLVFLISFFWFFGSRTAGATRLFVPLGLGIIALLVATLAVEPFLYSALLVEMAVLMSIPILIPPGLKPGQGVLRYLIFQSMGMLCILAAGWGATGVETNSADPNVRIFVLATLGLGLALWLAVFPFYTWVPLLVRESHPYVAGFILSLLPTFTLLLVLNFLDGFSWLRNTLELSQVLRLVGTFMVVIGGLWAAFERDLARLLGYGVILENGFAILALSLQNQVGYEAFAFAFFPRMMALALGALTLSIFKQNGIGSRFEDVKGLVRRFPINSYALVFALFALGGLPVLAMFPARQAILENLAKQSLGNTLWVLAGSVGFLISGFRVLAVFSNSEPGGWAITENWFQLLLLGGGILLLVAIGLFPSFFSPTLLDLLKTFPHLR